VESVTLNVRDVAFTATMGVPLIRPDEELSVKPLGNVPNVSAHVYGGVPPLAANVCKYGIPV
jgi:hypothetical protein